MYSIIASTVALAYILCDVNYFLRLTFTILVSRIYQKRIPITDTTTIYGFCTTQDVDIFLNHMNNARYLRELDFAKVHFYDRTGLYEAIVKEKGQLFQGASNIRYRRLIPIFTAYKIETRLVYWEGKAIFIEQKYITLNDGFTRAVILSRMNVTNTDVDTVIKSLNDTDVKPECPEELKLWLQSIEYSSAQLRKKDL